MSYYYFKALHIIAVTTWFAGLFYIVRLFIYHTEAQEKTELEKKILSDQFIIMEKRLWYGITWPSCIVTVLFGLSLLHNFFPIKEHPWLIAKLFFVTGLLAYQFYIHKIFKQHQSSIFYHSSFKLRILNEVATIFLFSIVFLVVLKNIMSMGFALIGLFGLIFILMFAIKKYKQIRTKTN